MSKFKKYEGLTFSEALESAKQGALIARKGWNGKGMFIFIRPGDNLSVGFMNNVKSLPESVKEWFNNNHPQEAVIQFSPYLCMKSADGTIVNGWLASQSDLLANDWVIIQ
jgi:hypothetical protein